MVGFAARIAARFKGEVPADTLEAGRRAGGVAYSVFHEAEQAGRGSADPWGRPQPVAAQMVCAWNAFVLQCTGEHLMDADYSSDPRTAGFVPEVTYRQVFRLFTEAEQWSSRAVRAGAGEIPVEVGRVNGLPAWEAPEDCPEPYLLGLLAAVRGVRDHAEAAWGDFEQMATEGRAEEIAPIRALRAESAAAADYAEALLAPNAGPGLREEIVLRLQRAMDGYYRLGQHNRIALPAR